MGEWRPVYRDGHLHVAADRCSTCIFRPGNLMSLAACRVKLMVEESVAGGGVITCHKTLAYGPDPVLDGAVCRGFYDAPGARVPGVRPARAMDLAVEVPVP